MLGRQLKLLGQSVSTDIRAKFCRWCCRAKRGAAQHVSAGAMSPAGIGLAPRAAEKLHKKEPVDGGLPSPMGTGRLGYYSRPLCL